MKKAIAWILVIAFCTGTVYAAENEVFEESRVKVFVREHPQTGKPFVSLHKDFGTKDLFKGFVKREVRPDYKMLDAKTKSGDVPYDGPVSNRKRVYIFAATMMTLGVAGGIATAAIPATTAAAGAGGGGTGILGAGAATVLVGTAGTVAVQTHINPGEENYVHDGTTAAVSGNPKNLSLRDVLREIDADEKAPVMDNKGGSL